MAVNSILLLPTTAHQANKSGTVVSFNGTVKQIITSKEPSYNSTEVFYLENKDKIEVKSQFPIGEYFKQLYIEYNHPKFVVDFLVIYNSDGKTKQSVIEYDGLKDHFENTDLITDSNYEDYYTIEHEERQKTLETYGFNFIRLNKFNISDNPVKYLDQKLKETFKKNGKIKVI